MDKLRSEADLRALYPPPIERARLKVLHRLDQHCANFIALSPFLCVGTSSDEGADVAPRGDEPGFVHILDDTTLAIPDWPGNNRLDSSSNIVVNPQVGLLFIDFESPNRLRVKGRASVSTDDPLLAQYHSAQLIVRVQAEAIFPNCPRYIHKMQIV